MNMTRKQQIASMRAAQREGLPTGVEIRQIKLAENTEAMERELARLIRVVNRINALRQQRKRLLKPAVSNKKAADWTPDKYVGSGGGALDDSLDDI